MMLETVGLADRGDLFEVMPAVNELKHSPLICAERAKGGVSGAPVVAEEPCGFDADVIEVDEVLCSGLG